MRLDLSRVRSPHEHIDRRYAPEAFAADADTFVVVEPVVLSLDVHKADAQYRLAGGVTTTLEASCSRCLETFRIPVDASFDLRYFPQSSNAGDGEREIEEDDLSTAYYQDDEIDLGQLMREQFYLAMPMKPLCRDDCAGLCPVCGINLNKGGCSCTRQWEDPRFAALKALKKDS
jgi:uncharacterized protein